MTSPIMESDFLASTMTSLDVTNATENEEDIMLGQKIVIPIIFALIFFCGIIGNGTLIAIVLLNKEMRNTPNIFIVSLALGDFILLLISVPFTAPVFTMPHWPFGLTMCKVGCIDLNTFIFLWERICQYNKEILLLFCGETVSMKVLNSLSDVYTSITHNSTNKHKNKTVDI